LGFKLAIALNALILYYDFKHSKANGPYQACCVVM